MKKFLTFLGLLASSLLGANAIEPVVVYDLTNSTNFNQCEQISFKYNRTSKAISFWANGLDYYSSKPYDDYLITPNLKLQKNHRYVVTSAPACGTDGQTADFYIYYGQGSKEDAQNFTEIAAYLELPYIYATASNTTVIEDREAEFKVDSDGEYRVAFRGVCAGEVYAFRVKILDYGSATQPEDVTDFVVTADPDGKSQATISFTMPSLDLGGNDLSDVTMTYNIYRDGELIKTASSTGGSQISYLDESVEEGNATYSLEIVRGDDKTDLISVTLYVGVEDPNPVSNLVLSGKEGDYKLSWVSPVNGKHGLTLNPDKISFKIVRNLGDTSEVLEENYKSTEYTDDYSSEVLVGLSYEVFVKYDTKISDGVKSNMVKIGSINLPFADSFAGAEIDELKWETEIISGTGDWKAAAKVGQSANSLTHSSVDDDGGLAYYDFYNNRKDFSARLMTMPISKSSTTSPIVDFWLWRFGASATSDTHQDRIELQIQVDGGEWQDITDAVFKNVVDDQTAEDAAKGWYNYKVGFGSLIPEDCKSYRLAFTAISDYGNNMAIDNVRIFNVAGDDLEAASLIAPKTIVAGNDLELVLTVNNNGADVKAEDYSIVIDSNYPTQIEVEPVNISSLSSAQFNISVPITAEEAYAEEGEENPVYNFTARIIYNDENNDNNETETVSVATCFLDDRYTAPSNVAVKAEDSNSVRFTWDSAKDLSYQAVNIVESFEEFEDNAEGPFNGFTILDLDGKAGDANYGYNLLGGSSFVVASPKVLAPSGTTSTSFGQFNGIDGEKCISVCIKGAAKQNDWIISPKINCLKGEDATLNVDFSICLSKPTTSSSTNLSYNYEVMYALDEYSAENPEPSFTRAYYKAQTQKYENPMDFERVSVKGIPGNAKYIAIHVYGDIGNYLNQFVAIDNICITENDEAPLLGYHIYKHEYGRMNEELLDENTLEYTHSDKARTDGATRKVYVTAVYDAGESMPSNIVEYTDPTGIEEILGAGQTIVPVDGGVMVSGYNGQNVEVYSIDGKRVASMKCADITVVNLEAGIYVVKVANDTRKVIVK